MDDEWINSALRTAEETHCVEIGVGILGSINRTFEECFDDHAAVVVADENTFAVAGRAVHDRLIASGRKVEEPIIYPSTPPLYANFENVLALEEQLRPRDAVPIAVGSGTLNDITKLAAHYCGRAYMIVATAASMDGYTAFGAAITREGFKQTFACSAPRAVLVDLDILAHAPSSMTASGYADLIGKITAGGDWLIADALEIEPINARVWSLVQDSLRTWIANPELLRVGNRQAIGRLVEGLILTGLAMQAHQTSRPASGSEHQFSHLWEMEGCDHGGASVSHGFKVGIGSIASAALYDRLLLRDLSNLDHDAICRAWPTPTQVEQTIRQSHTNPMLIENAVEQSLAKYISADQLAQRLALLRERWPTLRERLRAQVMTPNQIRGLLQAAGAPVDPAEIGMDLLRLKASYFKAWQIRRRYTIFDLAAEAGCFSECVNELFAPGGFWSRNATPNRLFGGAAS